MKMMIKLKPPAEAGGNWNGLHLHLTFEFP